MRGSLRLYEFLIGSFTEGELRRLFSIYYPDLAAELPPRGLSLAELTHEAVRVLQRSHAVDRALYAALVEMRPRLRADIERLAQPEAEDTGRGQRLQVLFVAANPAALPELQLSAEAARIEDKLRGTPAERQIEVRYGWRAGPESLVDLLVADVPDVLHFAGHGASDGSMLLEQLDGSPHPVRPEALAGLLGARARRPRMIVLNACYSVLMARALLPLVDAVIGMRAAVEDTAARTFAVQLYRALGHRVPLQEAFDLARAALGVHNLGHEDMPQLDVRGVDPRTYRLLA
jgi:hypothetical protein